MNSKTKSLLEVTGRDVRGKKHRVPFQEQIPCKLQAIIKKPVEIPRDLQAYFGE